MIKKIRRILLVAICILIFYLLQTTICKWMFPHTAAPNLLLILVMSIGLLRGRIEGMFTGFFCGLILDVFSGGIIGFHAFIYMYMGYFNGILKRSFVADLPLIPMLLCGVNEMIYHAYTFIFGFLIRNRLNFIIYLEDVIMPEVIVTILATMLFYWLILTGNGILERYEKKGASRFVS